MVANVPFTGSPNNPASLRVIYEVHPDSYKEHINSFINFLKNKWIISPIENDDIEPQNQSEGENQNEVKNQNESEALANAVNISKSNGLQTFLAENSMEPVISIEEFCERYSSIMMVQVVYPFVWQGKKWLGMKISLAFSTMIQGQAFSFASSVFFASSPFYQY